MLTTSEISMTSARSMQSRSAATESFRCRTGNEDPFRICMKQRQVRDQLRVACRRGSERPSSHRPRASSSRSASDTVAPRLLRNRAATRFLAASRIADPSAHPSGACKRLMPELAIPGGLVTARTIETAAVTSPTLDIPVAPREDQDDRAGDEHPLTIHSVGWMPKAGMNRNPAASEPVTEPSVLIA